MSVGGPSSSRRATPSMPSTMTTPSSSHARVSAPRGCKVRLPGSAGRRIRRMRRRSWRKRERRGHIEEDGEKEIEEK